jgi:MFS family permease
MSLPSTLVRKLLVERALSSRNQLKNEFRKYGYSGYTDKQVAELNANIVSTLQAGCFFGSLIAIWLCDRFGRRTCLLVSGFVTIIGCIMQAAASGSLAALYVGRLVAGFGVGAASMATPLYISENAPRAVRGALTGLYQLFVGVK